LNPVAEWRIQIPKSKGKRAKREAAKDESIDLIKPNPPDMLQYLTIGLNSTTRQLEGQQGTEEQQDQQLKAVFITHPFSSLQYAHLPLLAAMSLPPVLLVQLQTGSERELCAAVELPRLGMVGLRSGTPGCQALWELLKDLPIVQAPSLKEAISGNWMGTNIEVQVPKPTVS
jgi:hypothetical protein